MVNSRSSDKPVRPWRAQHLMFYCGPTDVAILHDLIDTIADSGFNMLCLHIGRAMRFARHPELALPYSLEPSVVREAVAHARQRRLEVLPVFNLMSHGSDCLDVYPQYATRQQRTIYNPRNPKLQRLILDMLDETIEVFQPRWLHIGHDEVISGYDPRKRHNVFPTRRGPELFAEDVCRLHDYLKDRSIRTMMWADALLDPRQFPTACYAQSGCYGGPPDHLETAIDTLPRDIVMCDWHYEPSREFPTIRYLQDAGFDTMGCPSFPVNTALFTRYALEHRTPHFLGMLVTAWHTINRRNHATLKQLIQQHGHILMHPQSCWHTDPLLQRIDAVCRTAGQPLPPGKSQTTYRYTIDGAGMHHSQGWSDVRFREYPRASTDFKGPALPAALELRAGREGHINYQWQASPGHRFAQASLRIDGTPLRIRFATKAAWSRWSAPATEFDLTPRVRGREQFRVQLGAANDTPSMITFLKRLDLTAVTDAE